MGSPHEHLGAGALPVFSPRARSPYVCPEHSGEQLGRSHDLLRACRVQTRTTPAIRQPPCHQPASFRRRPVLGNVSLECYDLNVVARRDRSGGWHQNGSRLGTPAEALRSTWYPRDTRSGSRGSCGLLSNRSSMSSTSMPWAISSADAAAAAIAASCSLPTWTKSASSFVTSTSKAFLRLQPVGGFDARVLVAQRVHVWPPHR
jgi:hypothetical protein